MLSLSVCVFCGSRVGKDNEYQNATEKLGRLLAEEDEAIAIDLVQPQFCTKELKKHAQKEIRCSKT